MRTMLSALLLVGALASSHTGCAARVEQQPTPIPPDSPFAKVQLGMSYKQVIDLIGEPTDNKIAATGKAWIPYYYGNDKILRTAYYKGIGRIMFTLIGSQEAIAIEYDPTEYGYGGSYKDAGAGSD